MHYLSFEMPIGSIGNGRFVEIELSMDSTHMTVYLDGEIIHDATGECIEWGDHWILEGDEAQQNEERILREAAVEQVQAYLIEDGWDRLHVEAEKNEERFLREAAKEYARNN